MASRAERRGRATTLAREMWRATKTIRRMGKHSVVGNGDGHTQEEKPAVVDAEAIIHSNKHDISSESR